MAKSACTEIGTLEGFAPLWAATRMIILRQLPSISLRVTDEKLFDYPFIYMIEPGGLMFSEEEVTALRKRTKP